MSEWAQHERSALIDALTDLGPDAPTLCEGWTTKDMAAHLYVRERRPDAALGVLPIGPLSAYTDRVMASVLRVHSYAELLGRLREAPGYVRALHLDEAVNTVEFFVHTEDVRRPSLPAREIPAELEQRLWKRMSLQGRLLLRRADVKLRLVAPDQPPVDAGDKSAAETVEVRGRPGEILLFAFNRKAAAHVDLVGSATAVDRLQQTRLGL